MPARISAQASRFSLSASDPFPSDVSAYCMLARDSWVLYEAGLTSPGFNHQAEFLRLKTPFCGTSPSYWTQLTVCFRILVRMLLTQYSFRVLKG